MVGREMAPQAVAEGAVVDNSSAWRMEEGVPLVVPEVNPRDQARHRGIIANPNCSTIQMVVALKPLHDAARIRRIVAATYLAVSGAGRKAAGEPAAQTAALLKDGRAPAPQALPQRIGFNLIPQIDLFQEGGYTGEEIKIVRETGKILHDPSIRVTATCVRVPVLTEARRVTMVGPAGRR